ncbi:kanadaptin-like [Teleopsis dalmanni]|uniref:kanadaptin n=1 Tax=Teleopsis dalmanni TaxID=139649 RepID=UPI0018CD3A19|nr:kanadaptin [Teleopsis dalmanni]XP_037952776.1 kanadaptin-like [Teleopsis dalmanni]
MEEFKIPSIPVTLPKTDKYSEENDDIAEIPPSKIETSEEAEPVNTLAQCCPYKIPPWSGVPTNNLVYKFEVLKSGQIIDQVNDLQKQATWKFGRLPANDIEMAHPTISRFHAVLQYKPKSINEDNSTGNIIQPEGWYVYDLGSTHGTFLNKQRLPSRVFIRIRVGHMLRLGASTRNYILQGPTDDEEPESELSVTELRAQRDAQIIAEAQRKAEEALKREKSEEVSWGMSEDADEETDLTHNPFASTNNEELFLDDPKRTLRGYFEREGLTLDYKCDEMSAGSFICRVELPLDDANGRPIVAEVVHKGRKKDCVAQCALEACRILDRHGVLRQSNQEPLKRKAKQNDDSDNDDFLDRTGDVERKKLRKSNIDKNVTLTYEDLIKKETDIQEHLKQVESNIQKYQDKQKRIKENKVQQDKIDGDLDAFMENLNDDDEQLDKTNIRKLRMEEQRLRLEQNKIERLIKIAKPTLIAFTACTSTQQTTNTVGKPKQLPMIGKRNQFSKFKVIKPITANVKSTVTKFDDNGVEIEEEEDEDEDEKEENNKIVESKSEDCTHKVSATQISPKHDDKDENAQSIDNNVKETVSTSTMNEKTANLTILTNKNMKKPITEGNEKTDSIPVVTNAIPVTEMPNEAKKRHRQKQRIRNKREEFDLDELEEHESSEKYAKWVPPENQTGDGFTELNKKYGY